MDLVLKDDVKINYEKYFITYEYFCYVPTKENQFDRFKELYQTIY